ncbi:MAG: hypothetical protein IPL61_30825 [Myxococcales bacterium]|nr:hypothetical protein [Myxococcales bacterium]
MLSNLTIRSLSFASLLMIAATGCSLVGKKSPAGGGGGGGSAAIADNMHDAPVHHRGETFTFTAPCRSTGYAKFDIADGEPVKISITGEGPEGAGLGTSYLRSTGGAVDGQMKGDIEVANGPIVFDVTGQEGGSFLQITETVPCKGVNVSVSVE